MNFNKKIFFWLPFFSLLLFFLLLGCTQDGKKSVSSVADDATVCGQIILISEQESLLELCGDSNTLIMQSTALEKLFDLNSKFVSIVNPKMVGGVMTDFNSVREISNCNDCVSVSGGGSFCKKKDSYKLYSQLYIVSYVGKSLEGEGFTVESWEKKVGGSYSRRDNLLEVNPNTVLKNTFKDPTPNDYYLNFYTGSKNGVGYGVNSHGCLKSIIPPLPVVNSFDKSQFSGKKDVIDGLECSYLKEPLNFGNGVYEDCINKDYCTPLILDYNNEYSSARFEYHNLSESFDESVFDLPKMECGDGTKIDYNGIGGNSSDSVGNVVDDYSLVDCGTINVSKVGDPSVVKSESSCFVDRAKQCLPAKVIISGEALGGTVSNEYEITGGTVDDCESRMKVIKPSILAKDTANQEMYCYTSVDDYLSAFPANTDYLYKCNGELKDGLAKAAGIIVGDEFEFYKGSLFYAGEKDSIYGFGSKDGNVIVAIYKFVNNSSESPTAMQDRYVNYYAESNIPAICDVIDGSTWSTKGSIVACKYTNGGYWTKVYDLLKNSKVLRVKGMTPQPSMSQEVEEQIDYLVQHNLLWQ